MTDALGQSSEIVYDALGNLTAVTYPDGTQDAYEYDALSRLVTYTPRQGDATAYTYNPMGDVLTVTVGGQTTSYEYDLLGRMTATVTADGARTEAAYDALGNLTGATDALGNATLYAYTPDSLLREIRYANGATLTASYDLVGNRIAETDPEGNTTAYEYDPVGRLTAVTDALGNTTRYEYDAADNLAKVTDALGHVTSYTYDALGNLTSETDALGHAVSYTYTPEGWLETVTDGSGHVTRYTYDRTGNVLTADYAGEQTETNTYNELGLLTTVTTAEGDTLYQYDQASRLISVTQPSGETVSYTYDSHGNRATMTYPNGKTVKYTYDDMNRLVSVKGVDGTTTRYSYDALGRRIATDGAKEDTVYTYDEVGNLISQTTTGKINLSLEYVYDLAGRMTQESRTENGATLMSSYTYDPLGQLTSFTRSDGQSETYTYDPAGNMTAKTQNGVQTAMRYNAANQLISSVTGSDTTRYTYDANGNLVRSENAGGARSYAYNALGLLEQFTREDGYTESYRYNANRLLSEIRTSEGLTTALTWDILYGDGVVIAENQNGQTTNYTYGLERISALSGSTRTEYVYDGRGSVAAELSYNTAWYTVGGLIARKHVTSKSYTPFGEQIGEAASGFGYNGEYYSADTGMIYLRARFYAPEMNRFGQKDTLRGSMADGVSLNRYLYCQSDPVNFADYNGRQMVPVTVSDGGGGSSSSRTTSISKAITKAAKTVSSAAEIVKKTVSSAVKPAGPSAKPTSSRSSQTPTTAKPAVQSTTVSLQSCLDPNLVIRDGNTITYMGKRYAIPAGSPITNWTPDAVKKYIVPYQTPLPPTQQITSHASVSSSERVENGSLNILGGILFTWIGAIGINTALGLTCPPAAFVLAFGVGGSTAIYGSSMAIEGINDILLARQGDTASTAVNPVRDTVFGGNQGAYDTFGLFTTMGSMAVSYTFPGFFEDSSHVTTDSRPLWRQSEIDTRTDYPNYREQVSFYKGKEVPYGTAGSVRPDFYKTGNIIEVKNYDITSMDGRNRLLNVIVSQYKKRITNLPAGTKQTILIDIRGQVVNQEDLNKLYERILEATENGVSILFREK